MKNIFMKDKRRLFLPLCAVLYSLFFILCPFSARADDEFYEDEFGLGEDSVLPDAVIRDSAGFEVGSAEQVYLNEDSEYADLDSMDISGAMLGMPFEDIRTLFFKTKTLYAPRKRNSIIYTIATDWRNNLDYECRRGGLYQPAKLEKCILTLARARGLLYPSELHLWRASTGETIDIFFTSNSTENVVWNVVYKNDANDVEGAGEKFADQRDKKILAFWENVLEKYGAPNSGDDRWISSDNSFDPMMTAYYGRLELTDMGLAGRDAALNVKQAKENFKPKPYAF